MRKRVFIWLFFVPFLVWGQSNEELDSTKVNNDSTSWNSFQERMNRITVSEICNVPFGCSYEKAESILRNKYGDSSSESDRTKIIYRNKVYAGISFDMIYFLFQSDGVNSYMNGCIFIIETKSLKEARDKQEELRRVVSYKYELSEYKDDNGEKYYVGGIPPKDSYDWLRPAFTIDILKYDVKEIFKGYVNGYATRLFYGRYNYIKEEF